MEQLNLNMEVGLYSKEFENCIRENSRICVFIVWFYFTGGTVFLSQKDLQVCCDGTLLSSDMLFVSE